MRYPAGLSSAVGRPQQSAVGKDAYPTIFEKTAALMHSLAQNQPFVDGNKRIAWIAGKAFLQIHGHTMHATDAEGLDLFMNRVRRLETTAPHWRGTPRHPKSVLITSKFVAR